MSRRNCRLTTLKAPNGKLLTLEVYDSKTEYRPGDLLSWPATPGLLYEIISFSEPYPMTSTSYYRWKGYI